MLHVEFFLAEVVLQSLSDKRSWASCDQKSLRRGLGRGCNGEAVSALPRGTGGKRMVTWSGEAWKSQCLTQCQCEIPWAPHTALLLLCRITLCGDGPGGMNEPPPQSSTRLTLMLPAAFLHIAITNRCNLLFVLWVLRRRRRALAPPPLSSTGAAPPPQGAVTVTVTASTRLQESTLSRMHLPNYFLAFINQE